MKELLNGIKGPFKYLDKDTLERIISLANFKKYNKGEFLYREENISQKIFFLLSGTCRKYYLHEGKEITLEFYFSNDIMISPKGFIEQEPAGNFVQSLSDVQVMVLDRNAIDKLMNEFPELIKLDISYLEYYILWLEKRLLSFQTQDATSRYLNLLKEDSKLVQNFPLGYIASYLGISLETLSRIRSKINK